MESAHPQPPGADRQHGAETGEHLLGSLVGEGDCKYAMRINLTGLHQPGDTCGQHPRLARACARQNQRMLRRQGDGLGLFGIEIGK
ncbi:hypothetical protein SDC9_178115 [bioreactor metagenome]|uniref:Uncharacterized protein n=1 Tax=bioreactor metagenome TaxID=1076179 RepID=A0A645H2U8_9ZZZZ